MVSAVLPFGILTGLDTPSTTREATKNKEGGLNNHKGLRDSQELGPVIGEVYLLHKTSLLRLGEVAVLCNVQKPTQRGKENKEMEEYVPNKRTS